MATRPYWNGHIRISLLSLPVELYSAVKSTSTISLHKIHEPSGKRVHHQNVVEGIGPVERDEIIRGYEYDKGKYVLLEPEELEELRLESKKTIDIVQFVDAHEIPAIYYEKPYYVLPKGELGVEAYAVIHEALRESRKVGLGQLTVSGAEKLVALKPCGAGLLLETLRYRDEVKSANHFFEDLAEVEVEQEKLDLAEQLIEKKSEPFRPEKYADHYQQALQELIDAKLENRKPEDISEPRAEPKVVNLMDALKKSVEQSEGAARRKTGGGKSSSKSKKSSRKGSGKKSGTSRAA